MAGKKIKDSKDANDYSKDEKNQISRESFRTWSGILEYLLDETFNVLLEFTTNIWINELDRILEQEGSKLSDLYITDIVAFRYWERDRLVPFLKELRRRELEQSIPTLPLIDEKPRKNWDGTQKELAVLAVDLTKKKKYRNLGVTCKALCKIYLIDGKPINFLSLYGKARQIRAEKE